MLDLFYNPNLSVGLGFQNDAHIILKGQMGISLDSIYGR